MGQGGWFNPDESTVLGQVEYAKEKTKELQGRKPESKFPLFGAILGIIAGIVTGSIIGNIFVLVGCVIAGGIIGTIFGSVIGGLITRWRRARDNSRRFANS